MLMLIRKSIEPSAEERLALGTVMVMMIIFDYHYDDNDYYYDDDDTYDHICGGTAYCLEAARASFIKFISFVADKITLYTRPSHSSTVNNKVTEAWIPLQRPPIPFKALDSKLLVRATLPPAFTPAPATTASASSAADKPTASGTTAPS